MGQAIQVEIWKRTLPFSPEYARMFKMEEIVAFFADVAYLCMK